MVLSVYKFENKQQLIKYYHASLGSHPKRTLIEAANAGYLKVCPGLTAVEIRKYVSVEDAKEMGHMTQKQQGNQSTTNRSRRGRSSQHTQQSDTAASIADAMYLPTKEKDNNRTHLVFMPVKRVEGYVASDQNRKVSKNVQQRHAIHLCLLYIRPKLYQGHRLKKQKKEELL